MTNLGVSGINEWLCKAKKYILQVDHEAVACNRLGIYLKSTFESVAESMSVPYTCIPARLTFSLTAAAKYSNTASLDSGDARTSVLNI